MEPSDQFIRKPKLTHAERLMMRGVEFFTGFLASTTKHVTESLEVSSPIFKAFWLGP
jgi:hypothetical protein